MFGTSLTITTHSINTASECYVMHAAREYCAGRGITVPSAVARNGNGKPFFFRRDDIHLSLSHSAGYIAVVISDSPVGVDIQQHKPCRVKAISERFFHPDEIFYLQNHPSRFFDVWTAKESYSKYTGEGIIASFGGFSVTTQNRFRKKIGNCFLSLFPIFHCFSVAVTNERSGDISVFIDI